MLGMSHALESFLSLHILIMLSIGSKFPKFSPSDWFFPFELDLKRVLALEGPRRSTNFSY
jgi:hypothetical protein